MRGNTLEQLVAEAQGNIRHITSDELHAAVENSERLVILDISDKELYKTGHLPGTTSLPRAAIELDIDEVVPNQAMRIVKYCGGNTRGSVSAHTLRIMGYENVSMLGGGVRGWKAEGLAVEGGESE